MYYVDPRLERCHVVILYRNFRAKDPKCSHDGLGVNGLHTLRMLRRHRIRADLFAVWDAADVARVLNETPSATHCLVEAPWLKTGELAALMRDFHRVHFLVRTHSEVAFLQVDPNAIALLREQMILAEQMPNLTIAANSRRLTDFLSKAYSANVLYLPNTYDLERVHRRRGHAHDHRLLRIGSFGAQRVLKNHTTSAAAALSLARERGCDLEFWMNVGREDGNSTVIESVRQLFHGLAWARFVPVPWQPWAEFRRTVGAVDLTLQPSFTESFNVVTADSVAEGVPAVVSHAVEWAPEAWKAHPDAISEIVRIGSALLSNPTSAEEGLLALERFVSTANALWLAYLSDDPSRIHR